MIALARRKILFAIDTHNLVDLLLKGLGWIFAGSRSNVPDTEFAGKLDRFDEVRVFVFPLLRIGLDMVLRHLERRYVHGGFLQRCPYLLHLSLTDRRGVQRRSGAAVEDHVRKPLCFGKLDVGRRVAAQNPEQRLPFLRPIRVLGFRQG